MGNQNKFTPFESTVVGFCYVSHIKDISEPKCIKTTISHNDILASFSIEVGPAHIEGRNESDQGEQAQF